MSIKDWYKDGVFEPLEKVEGAKPGTIYTVFSDEELRDIGEPIGWLKAPRRASTSGTTFPMPSTTRYKRGDIQCRYL